MGSSTRGKKKGLNLLGRGRAALSLGPGPSPREPLPAPDSAAAKRPPPGDGVDGETRRTLVQLPKYFFKFSWDRSKAPAEPKIPRSDTGPPRPDTEPPKQVLTSKDIHGKIMQLVHKELGPDAITLGGQANVKNLVGDIQQDVQRKCTNGPSRKMRRILKRVEYYFKIVDVAIQHQPQVVALVWAGVRTIVQISLNRLDALENLEQAIESVPTTILMAEFYHSLYDAFVCNSPEVSHNTELLGPFISILSGLYADIIVFMVKAKGYFEPASMTSSVGKSLVPFCLKFKPLMDEINEKEAALRKLMENVTMTKILENSEDLQVLKHTLDEWSENWKQLVRIEDRLSRVIDDHEKEKLIKCRKWLHPLQNPEAELGSNLSSKTEGTCTWIKNTEEFGLMIEGDEQNHLWIEGKPGAGKSVLLSYLVHTTRKNSTRKNPVLYFFCKDGSSETSTAAAIVANLIDQLVTQTELEPLLNILSMGREKHENSTHCTDFAILWELFLQMVRGFPARIIIFVDALDECSEKERSAFMGALVSLPGNACLCITSRGLPDIERAFQGQGHQRKILKIEMQSQEDIVMFLNESIDRNQELHCHREKVLEKVAFHARGMFRYAALLVGELLHSPCQNISAALESPPADLNEMYETILLRLDTEPPRDKPRHRTQRKRILQWVTAARQPLKPSELAWSCAAVEDEESFDLESVDIRPQELMKLCSPLLEIVDGCVHFTHLSAKEFLLQKPEDLYSRDRNRREQVAFYLVDNIEAHVLIATVGVTLSRHVTGAKVKGCYPIINWPRHAQDVATSQQTSQDIQNLWDRVSRFLVESTQYLAWALEFPWKQVLVSMLGYHPTRRGGHPRALDIVSHYGLDQVLSRLLPADIGMVELEYSLRFGLLSNALFYAIYGGFARIVQLLLDFGVKVETRCGVGNTVDTPLYIAASQGNEKITQLLLDRGAEIEARDREGWTPLSYATWRGFIDVARLLLDRGAEIKTRSNAGKTPLYHAAECPFVFIVPLVRLLLDRGAEIETQDNIGITPLSRAAWRGSIDVVRLLLDRGAEIETRDNSGKSPLSYAAWGGFTDIVRLLLNRGAEIEVRDRDGWTPLTNAVSEGYTDVVRLLLDRGAEIETRNSCGRTQLYLATQNRREDVIRLLLDRGAEIEARDPAGWTPLTNAVSGGSLDVVRLLLDYGAEIETRADNGWTPLSYAVKEGSIDVVRLLLDRGADIETRTNNGWTPLLSAALTGSIDVVRLLLDRGAGIETRDNHGWTPLTNAVLLLSEGCIDVVRLLLDRGAEIETRDDHGWTPLSYAALKGSIDAVRLLLDRGAEIETRDNSSQTPLFCAARGGGKNVTQLLLNRGAEIETRDHHGCTPLSFAVLIGSIDVVRLLLDYGAEIDSRDDGGHTPLSFAAIKGSLDVVRLLLDGGAELETRADDGWTPLSHAALKGFIDVVRLLLDRGADIEMRANSGLTPLSCAAWGGGEDATQLLLDRGAEIETRDDYGRTPLSYAVSQGSIDVVRLLLDRGAEVETRDNSGRTPLSHAAEFAASHGYSAMVCFLLTWPTISIDSQDDEGRTAIGWAETISEQRTGRDKIASEEIVALLKVALLQRSRN